MCEVRYGEPMLLYCAEFRHLLGRAPFTLAVKEFVFNEQLLPS